jgi:hypothetical protein
MGNKKIGLEARRKGRKAEKRVVDELLSYTGWSIEVSPELDYAKKTDVTATCPLEKSFPLQVSVDDKSSRERKKLERRGITSVSLRRLHANKQTVPEFLCNQCPLREHCDARVSTTLGATALTSMRAK